MKKISLYIFALGSLVTNAQTFVSTIPENKKIIKVIDLLGRETKGTKNEVLFHIFDDGTVEKRIVIE